MPSEAKPLFRSDALRPKLVGFGLPPGTGEARTKLGNWVTLLANKQAETMKETELLPGFITDLFERLLGFAGPESGDATYTLKREALIKVDGKQADAALGGCAWRRRVAFIVVAKSKRVDDGLGHRRGHTRSCQLKCTLSHYPVLHLSGPSGTN